jgi:hypothetical protein
MVYYNGKEYTSERVECSVFSDRAYAACTYQSSKLFISGGYSGSIPGPVTASVQSSIQ